MSGNISRYFLYAFMVSQERHLYLFNSKYFELYTFIWKILHYLLTPWSRDLFVRLTGSQPVKKFPAFYGTRRFITAFTTAHHLSLS